MSGPAVAEPLPAAIRAGDHVVLRPWTPEDAERLFRLVDANRAFLARWLPWAAGAPLEMAVEFIKHYFVGYQEGSGLELALEVDGELAGHAGYIGFDRAERSGELGYWLAGAHKGRGHMTEACRALVDHGLRTLGLDRVVIRAATRNAPSRAIPERLGFRFEGIERAGELPSGEPIEMARYAVQSAEWTSQPR